MESLLLYNGANIECQDRDGKSPLHMAIKSGSIDMVSLLLDNGANINCEDANGQNEAIKHVSVHIAVVLLLLEKGADPQCRDRGGRTPLHLATTCGRPYTSYYMKERRGICIFQELFDRGVNVDCQDKEGLTPLHKVITATNCGTIGSYVVRFLLLEAGANIHVKANHGIYAF